MILKCLYGRINSSKGCLFPWLDCGNDISNFSKIDFFVGQVIFHPVQEPYWAPEGILCINKVDIQGYKNRKMCKKSKILLKSRQGTSQLSVDSFVDLWDRLVAQKWEIKIFLSEKVANPGRPPTG